MPEPRVTAVIPCHNHAPWVWGAVESVALQDYPAKQVVVVDDGSSDGSHDEVLRRLYKPQRCRISGMPACKEAWVGTVPNNGTKLHVVRFAEAHGPSFARNRGMEVVHAETDIFAFLDSDDYYHPGKLARSVAEFRKAPGLVGAVYTDYDTVRPDGLRVREFKEPFDRRRLLQECILSCNTLVSLQAIRTCDGFDESLRVAEDYDLWLRVSERFLIVHVPESLTTIRVGQHSSTATVRSEVWQACWRRVMEKAAERARNG